MRTEIERIQAQVHRSFAGGAWHGPSVAEVLRGVNVATAVLRPLPNMHSIAELVAHLEFTQRIVLERLEGRGRLTTDEESWPSVPGVLSSDQWTTLVHDLEEGAAALERAVSKLPPDRLDLPLVAGGSSAFNNILGYAQHNAYHAGQISLLKKLAAGTTD